MPKPLQVPKGTTGCMPLSPNEVSDAVIEKIEEDAHVPTGESVKPGDQRDTGRKRFKGKCHQRTRHG